ncbi:MAG TPA: hypothetical protein PK286_04485 [Devosia sp.]|nr:hypothetical protein [Devosia sp.]
MLRSIVVVAALLAGPVAVCADGFEPGAMLEDELATAIGAAVGEYMGSAPQAEQDKAIACMTELVAPLGAEAKTELVFSHMGGTADVPLVEAHEAGLGERIWACVPG